MTTRWTTTAGMLAGWIALGVATPALADVKAGVEAWARGDYKAAVEQWRGPAVAGDADAQFNLAQAYKFGRGVPADLAQAEEWYRKAAVQGHKQAADNYGLVLFQDNKKAAALPWLQKAAAHDEKRNELVLGTMLFNGDGVPKDPVRAYALISRASQQGLAPASATLAEVDGYVSPEQRQQGTAMAAGIAADAKTAAIGGGAGRVIAAAPAAAPARAAPRATPVPTPSPSPAPTRRPASVAPPAPRGVVSTPGGWKVQLGAFRDGGNARALWSRLAGRMGGAQPDYQQAGGFTRLLAGPFASRDAATRACGVAKGAGAACVVVGR